jgi:glycosyltransferase 2 family protein
MSEPATANRSRTWLLRLFKLSVVLLLAWAVHGTIATGLEQLKDQPLSLRVGPLLAAAAIYLIGLAFAGAFWVRVLRRLGQEVRWLAAARAYYIGHLGKYVPGKAMVVVLRAGLIRSKKIDTGVAAVSVFYETLTMMSVGAFWAASVLAVVYRHHWILCMVAIGLMIASGLPVLPPCFRRLIRLTRVGRTDPATLEKINSLGWGLLFEGFVLMSVCWFLLAASYAVVLWSMGVEQVTNPESIPLLLAAVSLAMVAGFLSLIPGGAVVRELVLTELVAPALGSAIALAGAVLLRLVWLGAELALSSVLYLFKPKEDTKDGQ